MKRNEQASRLREINLKVIGYKARQFRRNNGWSQQYVADTCRMSARQISTFENGRNDSAYILFTYIQMGLEL